MRDYAGKFSAFNEDDEHVQHDYGNRYYLEPCGDVERLVIGPTDRPMDLMLDLAAGLIGNDWALLYVLKVSRCNEHRAGRYQSPPLPGYASVEKFLRPFQEYLQGDGRHDLWINCFDAGTLFVYDHHEVIYIYGELSPLVNRLGHMGYSEEVFRFPGPHSHHYHSQFDDSEVDFLSAIGWTWSPLHPKDE